MAAKWLQDVFTLVLGEFGGKMLRDVIRGELREGAGVIAERIRTIVKENPRADLALLLLALEPQELERFLTEYRRYKGTTQENSFVVTIAQLLPRKTDKSLDMDRAKEVYGRLIQLGAEELDDLVEILKHDPISQKLRPLIKAVANAAGTVISAIERATSAVIETAPTVAASVDEKAEQAAVHVRQFRLWLESKGVRR